MTAGRKWFGFPNDRTCANFLDVSATYWRHSFVVETKPTKSYQHSSNIEMMQQTPGYFTQNARGDRRKLGITESVTIHLSHRVLSIYFAILFPIRTKQDQLRDVFFESPLTCAFSGVTEEAVNHQKCSLLREDRSFTNCENAVSSMVYDYFESTSIVCEEINIFSDYTCSQNKN